MSSFTIYAGAKAFRQLAQEGLHRDQFDTLVGASGGPKWFVLYGLDRYLFGDFLPSSAQTLTTIGSSAGAWRMCCLATGNPVAAIERLAQRYSHERYSHKPTVQEITSKAREMVAYTLGEEGVADILNNSRYHTHIVADRCRSLSSNAGKTRQTLLLAAAMGANGLSRKSLAWFFERTVFTNGSLELAQQWDDLPTAAVSLSEQNLMDAMMATGSIPFVLEGVKNIHGAKKGIYWDGGITDYHFDLPFNRSEKLVLYPHFSSSVIPGWFDKRIAWRKVNAANYDNVVLVTPSKDFVSQLPYGKIPDRNDFNNFGFDERIKYWEKVLDASQRIGEEFSTCVETGKGLEYMKPFADRDR